MQTPKQEQRITVNATNLASLGNADVIRVLHVDDDLSAMEISKQILMELAEFEIDNASSVNAAFQKLETGNYDVVISDYEMPQKNGLQFLKELREKKNDIPFILFTGKGREEVAIKAINLGAHGYFNKQGDPETVYGELANGVLLAAKESKSKSALQESAFNFHTIANFAHDWIYWMNPDGKFIYVSPSCEKITGFKPEEFIENSALFSQIISPQDMELVKSHFESFTKNKEDSTEFRIVNKNGDVRWISHVCTPVYDGNGKWLGRRAANIDITERKRTENLIRESEEKYRLLFESSLDGVIVTNVGSNVDSCSASFANSAAASILGYDNVEDLLRFPLVNFYANSADRQTALELLFANGVVKNFETKAKRKDGQLIDVSISISVSQRDSQGKIVQTQSTIRDITERKKNELEKQKKYEALERVAENIGAGIAVISNDYQVTWANSTLRSLGVSSNKKCYQTFNHLNTICPDCGVKKIFEQNLPFDVHEYKTTDSKGETAWIELRVTPLRDKNGNVTAALELAVPVTERKKTEELIRKNKDQLNAILSNAPIGIATSDPNKLFLSANPAFCKILGYSEKELRKLTFKDITYADDIPESVSNMERLCSGKISFFSQEKRYNRKDGTVIDGKITVTSIQENERSPLLFVAELEDITERKKMEDSLRKSNERYMNLFESARDVIATLDLKGNITSVNKAATEYGFKIEDIIGKNMLRFVPKKYWPKIAQNLVSVSQGNTSKGDIEIATPKGEIFIEFQASPIIQNSKIDGVMVILRNNTERKAAEDHLESLKKFDERVIDSLGDALLIIDPEDYTILNVNKSVLDQLKLERKDLIGKTCYRATHSLLVPCGSQHPCPIRKVLETGKPITVEHTHLDNEHNELFVEVSAYPVKNVKGKTVVIHVAKNITQRKLMERDLRASEEKFRAITDCALDAIVMIDDKQRIVYWNPAAERIFGYKKDEVLGTFSSFLVPKRLHESMEKGLSGINKNSSKPFAGTLETVGRKKNGVEFPLEISGSQMQMREATFSVAILRDATERKRMQNKLNEYSSHLKYMVELRTAQLKDANERLVRSERLATIGELAGMIGHDLRNPLAGIKNATYLLKKKGTAISEANYRDMLEIIEKAIGHSDKIINELLDYAREIHLELQDCSLRKLLTEVLVTLKIPKKVKIINNIPEKSIVRIDESKLERVFINLVKNAIDAMPNGGALTIESKIVAGNSEISFADTGSGISDEILPKLFLPLITTKAQGMGFGLAICKRIIEAHRGTITVKTAKGKGTTFIIALPLKSKF